MSSKDKFSNFAAVQAYLAGLGFFHWDLTLDRVREVLAQVRIADFNPISVQIVGTNGKGSTATFLASLAQAQGLKTGLYTSPHFASIRERVLLDNRQLSESDWTLCANLVWEAGGESLTYFEFVTMLGYVALARAGVDFLVLETGLGGRNDATSVMPVDMVLFTPIGIDHENILGPGLLNIAADKADALTPGRGVWTAIAAPQDEAVWDILAAAARRAGCPLYACSDICPLPADWALGLPGNHQQINAQLALAAWRLLAEKYGLPGSDVQARQGLAAAFIPGRLQIEAASAESGLPQLILDGAHNQHGLVALSKALQELEIRPEAVIFSGLADKDLSQARELLAQISCGPIYVPPINDNPRAAEPQTLAAGLGERARAVHGLAAALEMVKAKGYKSVLICGSLYLLGEFYTLHPQYLGKIDR